MNNERLKEIYESLSEEQLEIVDEYCKDNLKKLKKLCSSIVRKVCFDSNADEDDLYDIATDVLVKSIYIYDASRGKLETFLGNNIKKKISSYIRDTKYTYKRSNVQKNSDGKKVHISNISLNEPTEEGINLSEKIDSGFEIENNILDEIGFSFDDKVEKYIKELPIKVQKVALLISQAYTKNDIIRILNIEEKQYSDAIKTMRQSEFTSIIF